MTASDLNQNTAGAVMTLRLVRSVPCERCGGKGKYTDTVASVAMGYISNRFCSTCDGRGTTEEPVSCAGCRWFGELKGETCDELGWCSAVQARRSELADDRYQTARGWIVPADFGCLSWQPKEEQS